MSNTKVRRLQSLHNMKKRDYLMKIRCLVFYYNNII